jgi:hypothetical protein
LEQQNKEHYRKATAGTGIKRRSRIDILETEVKGTSRTWPKKKEDLCKTGQELKELTNTVNNIICRNVSKR